MKPTTTVQELLSVIRKRMKSERYTYADAATALNVSVPTIKRAFYGQDLAFSKILKLADWLDLTLRELVELSLQDSLQAHTFSENQEKFFAQNPNYLAYLFALHNRSMAPEQIAKEYKLSKHTTQKYLLILDKLGLIKQQSGDKIKVLVKGTITWSDNGTLGKLFSKKMVHSLANRIASNLGTVSDQLLILQGVSLNEEGYAELKRDFEELTKKYRLMSNYNQKIIDRSKRFSISYAIMADKWEEQIFNHIAEIPHRLAGSDLLTGVHHE